jgi:hypothetical protein
MPVITDEFRLANYYEAGLWIVIGLIALGFALRGVGHVRSRCLILAVTLVVFGFSDVVETRTGAWWRPWWLFVWKAACVAVLLALLVEHYWRRFRLDPAASTRADADGRT